MSYDPHVSQWFVRELKKTPLAHQRTLRLNCQLLQENPVLGNPYPADYPIVYRHPIEMKELDHPGNLTRYVIHYFLKVQGTAPGIYFLYLEKI